MVGTSKFLNSNDEAVYCDILESLKNDFQTRWKERKVSESRGLARFERVKTLGEGTFGQVILMKTITHQYAVKCLSKKRIIETDQMVHIMNEKRMLEAIRFPFIIHMEFSFKDNSYVYFFMPFINGGDMFRYLRKMRKFPEVLSKFYAAQILLALEFLHVCDIVHRDLKPENILIDNKGYIKVADLGFCKIVKGRTYTLCGTPEYMAPEIILSKGYGKSVDWWSFGVLLYEMNAGFTPFSSKDAMMVIRKIVTCKYICPETFTNELHNLIENTIEINLTKRFGNLKDGALDVKNHSWFLGIDFMAIYYGQMDPPFKPFVKSENDLNNFEHTTEEALKISKHKEYEEQFKQF